MKIIHVPMEVQSVRKLPGRDGRPVYQVDGYVGDYSVLFYLDEDEANATGVAAQAK